MTSLKRVLVIGGGLAGLTLGIAAKQKGLSPHIVEKTEKWTPKGAGIHLYSNALRAFDSIGLAHEIAERGSCHDDYYYADSTGTHTVKVTYPRIAGPDLPALCTIRRTDLHELIIAEAARLDVEISLGTMVDSLEESAHHISVVLSNGAEHEFDLVVAADGIYSQTRSDVLGENPAKYTGQGIWRALVPRHEKSKFPKIMFAGGGQMFGVVPVSANEVYLLCGCPESSDVWYPREQFHNLISEKFATFEDLAPFYLDQICEPDDVTYTAIEEVHQKPPWHKGRIFFVGDAVHASTPYLAQGAAMAIEDSIVMAELIATHSNTETLAAEFLDRRYNRVAFIQQKSIERNKQRYHGGEYRPKPNGRMSERMQFLQDNAQRQVDEIYTYLAKPI